MAGTPITIRKRLDTSSSKVNPDNKRKKSIQDSGIGGIIRNEFLLTLIHYAGTSARMTDDGDVNLEAARVASSMLTYYLCAMYPGGNFKYKPAYEVSTNFPDRAIRAKFTIECALLELKNKLPQALKRLKELVDNLKINDDRREIFTLIRQTLKASSIAELYKSGALALVSLIIKDDWHEFVDQLKTREYTCTWHDEAPTREGSFTYVAFHEHKDTTWDKLVALNMTATTNIGRAYGSDGKVSEKDTYCNSLLQAAAMFTRASECFQLQLTASSSAPVIT